MLPIPYFLVGGWSHSLHGKFISSLGQGQAQEVCSYGLPISTPADGSVGICLPLVSAPLLVLQGPFIKPQICCGSWHKLWFPQENKISWETQHSLHRRKCTGVSQIPSKSTCDFIAVSHASMQTLICKELHRTPWESLNILHVIFWKIVSGKWGWGALRTPASLTLP